MLNKEQKTVYQHLRHKIYQWNVKGRFDIMNGISKKSS